MSSSLALIGKVERLRRLQAKRRQHFDRKRTASRLSTDVGLADFLPTVTPRWTRPDHLTPLVRLFERIAQGERVRALVSVPPRHGKTELVLHAFAWLLRKFPHLTHAYASYSADLSRSKSRAARDYALAAGVQLRDDSSALNEWRTPDKGGLLATGVGGPLTGHGVDGVLVVDDPHKNRVEAESAAMREAVRGWWTSTAVTRLEPKASAIVIHTRWHEDDLIGWLQNEHPGDWEVINLAAIAEVTSGDRRPGEALWPARWPLEALAARRTEVGEYDWASLYQGRPRPKGGAVFGDVHLYAELPKGYRVAIGIDLAYTERTSADYSVAVVVAEADGRFYVLDVHRVQVAAPQFGERLRALRESYPGARLVAYVGGTEKGVVDLLNKPPAAEPGKPPPTSLGIEAKPALADKFVRAQGTAAHWNAGKVFLPAAAPPWADAFVSELRGFTGVRDRHDDQVDALVAAHDALAKSPDISLARVPSRR